MSGSDSWYVQLADGDVHRVTLDQLDEAFQLGHVGASTMVLAPEGGRWMRLGHIASIDEPSEPLSSQRPVSMDLSDVQVSPPRSAKRWVASFLLLALLSAVGTTAVTKPRWADPYWARVRNLAGRSSHWVAATAARVVSRHASSSVAASQKPASPTAAASVAPPTAAAMPAPIPPAAANPPALATAVQAPSEPAKPTPGAERPAIRKGKTHGGPKAIGASRVRATKPPSTTFSTGGSKYDPMSSSI
jgi:hypothetical protein